ncbi:MAG: hypothetical protein JXB24_14985, partial [Bacteroidales bacterium]|nr:hypothetical protein [Bacteroidales bacterium]
ANFRLKNTHPLTLTPFAGQALSGGEVITPQGYNFCNPGFLPGGKPCNTTKRFNCQLYSVDNQPMKRKLPMPDTTTDKAYVIKDGHAMA